MTMMMFEIIASDFRKGVAVEDRTYHGKTYEKCFVGREAVDYLVKSGAAPNRKDAVTIGRSLAQYQDLFEHVTGEHEFCDGPLFFRFRPETKRSKKTLRATKDIINEFRKNVVLEDRTYLMKTYKQCFVGSEAVDCLIDCRAATNRVDAVKIGQALLQHQRLFAHVTGDHDFEDGPLFYQLTTDDTTSSTDKENSVTSSTLSGTGKRVVSAIDIDEIAHSFRKNVSIADRKYGLKTYKQTFLGNEAVDLLVESGHAVDRQDAVRIGQALEKSGLFGHVTGDHCFRDEGMFYRFATTHEDVTRSTSLSPRGLGFSLPIRGSNYQKFDD